MSSKSPQRKLREASELAAVVGFTNRDLVVCMVTPWDTSFHLKPSALVKAFEALGAPKKSVKCRVDDEGNLHVEFSARGARWSCCVLATDPKAQELRRALEGRKALPAPPQLVLTAPAPPTLFLGDNT